MSSHIIYKKREIEWQIPYLSPIPGGVNNEIDIDNPMVNHILKFFDSIVEFQHQFYKVNNENRRLNIWCTSISNNKSLMLPQCMFKGDYFNNYHGSGRFAKFCVFKVTLKDDYSTLGFPVHDVDGYIIYIYTILDNKLVTYDFSDVYIEYYGFFNPCIPYEYMDDFKLIPEIPEFKIILSIVKYITEYKTDKIPLDFLFRELVTEPTSKIPQTILTKPSLVSHNKLGFTIGTKLVSARNYRIMGSLLSVRQSGSSVAYTIYPSELGVFGASVVTVRSKTNSVYYFIGYFEFFDSTKGDLLFHFRVKLDKGISSITKHDYTLLEMYHLPNIIDFTKSKFMQNGRLTKDEYTEIVETFKTTLTA